MQSEQSLQPDVLEVGPEEAPPAEPLAPKLDHTQVHLSPQSIWPITTAAGITLLGGGLVTIPVVSLLGLIVMIVAIVSWVQELRHEPHDSH
jgi:hypothetical protein